jgi:hypothetical protein
MFRFRQWVGYCSRAVRGLRCAVQVHVLFLYIFSASLFVRATHHGAVSVCEPEDPSVRCLLLRMRANILSASDSDPYVIEVSFFFPTSAVFVTLFNASFAGAIRTKRGCRKFFAFAAQCKHVAAVSASVARSLFQGTTGCQQIYRLSAL